PQVLIGGLGMGFTLRAALDILPADAIVRVAELVPAVVDWNRGPLAPQANHPLDDPRVEVIEADVAEVIRAAAGQNAASFKAAGRPASQDRFDAILLDVDNGPIALTAASNAALYAARGLTAARAALRPGGTLAVWSATDDSAFERRLQAAGFRVQRHRVQA